MRWPDDVPTVKMNHDPGLSGRYDGQRALPVLLDQMGYRLETQTVSRSGVCGSL